MRAVRASGPGGQNVNKVATKIELRVDLEAIEGLPAAAQARLHALASHRLDADGRLLVTSQATRNQARNIEDARDKVRRLVAVALVPPRPRVETRTPGRRGAAPPDVKRRRAASSGCALGRPPTTDRWPAAGSAPRRWVKPTGATEPPREGSEESCWTYSARSWLRPVQS